ncbi:MAG: Mrp/NBP35 family ATP-binding protein [Proteobacteria bacterium]|nr:Mrp/NBP35 family ATP-binding protein [Pseudomonadota bacterium]
MREQIQHIVHALLFDNAKSLQGDRELRAIDIQDDIIHITLAVESHNSPLERFEMEDAIRDAVLALFSDKSVRLTSIDIHGQDAAGCPSARQKAKPDLPPKKCIPGVRHVYLVCSAKGGVGKSTVALNTALALKAQGHAVGLLDLDLYGPSIPSLVGSDLPPIIVGNHIIPPEIHGMSVLSIGFMIEKGQPLMWRGPMVASVVNQLLWEVDWSGNDYLIIDMPPGTGDTYMSILQQVQVDAAVIVTTPSQLALADVTRGLGIFEAYGVDVAGVVENMASYDWEGRDSVLALIDGLVIDDEASQNAIARIRRILNTTKTIRIFGSRTQTLCDELELPLIASIPLDIALQNDNDNGTPYMLNPKKPAIRQAFEQIAAFILQRQSS